MSTSKILPSLFTTTAFLIVGSIVNLGASPAKSAPALKASGIAAAYPLVYENGTETARATAMTTAGELVRRANYELVSQESSESAWAAAKLPMPAVGHMPTRASLRTFGRAVHANKVVYGSVSWHTRSIWVNAGPKTISTATVNAYVYDVASNKVVFRKTGVEGRSDEKTNGYKIAADLLFTPLVTAVSGGPATPQEQRSVQIAMAKAYQSWVKQGMSR